MIRARVPRAEPLPRPTSCWIPPALLSAALLALCVLLWAPPARAQERPASISEKQEEKLNAGLAAPPEALDRSTPLKAWTGLLSACQSKAWDTAPHYLNLGDIEAENQRTKGAALARQLCDLLRKTDQLGPVSLNNTALGPMDDDKPRNYAVPAAFDGPRGKVEVWLRRVADKASGGVHWVVTRKTLSKLPLLHKALVKGEEIAVRELKSTNTGLGPLPADFDLHSPRDAATLFVTLTREGKFEQAARLLDLGAVPPKKQADRGERLARRLAMVLKRIAPGFHSGLSNDSEGSPEQGVPLDEEVVARTTLDEQPVDLRLTQYMRPAPEGEGLQAVWLFSSGTVATVDAIYKGLGYGWAGDYLPAVFFELEVWDVQLWQWIGLLLCLIAALVLGYIFSYLTRKVFTRVAKATDWKWDDAVVASMRGPLVMAYCAAGFVVVGSFLALADKPAGFILAICKLVAISAFGWFMVRIVDVAADVVLQAFRDREDDMGIAMVPVARKILKALIVAIVVIVALQNMGMNVGGLLAGLGIGGLAIAMAAKTTLENLIGGITIAFDRPFKVGDYISLGGITGTVEDLGLRSCRIRTLDRTLITIPNGQMVDSKIENFAFRDKVRLVLTFGVQYDTSPEQIAYIVDEFKRYLLAHERVMDGFRVRFSAYGGSSQDIEVVGYIATADYTEFTGIREGLLFDLGRIIGEAGAEFAFPSQTVYVGKESQADGDKAKKAAATVAERREAGELCLPEIPEKVETALKKSPEPPSVD